VPNSFLLTLSGGKFRSRRLVLAVAGTVCIALASSCDRAAQMERVSAAEEHSSPLTTPDHREQPASRPAPQVRGTGKLRAVSQQIVQAPRLQGRNNRFTLTYLIANGSRVSKDEVLAEFDRTAQAEEARTAAAQLDDLTHQIEQRRAENRAHAAKRSAEMREAQAGLEKANIQLRIAEIRSDIDRDKSKVQAETARTREEMLKEIHRLKEEADAADLRILDLQRDRQEVAFTRARRNAELLVLRSPLDGMVALEAIWRNNSRGPAQVGDQLYRGTSLVRVFDPTQIELTAEFGEPDGALLIPGAQAEVILDAYPKLIFHATLESASPVAAAALGSPIRRFVATFLIQETDPHLLPDLTAQVILGASASSSTTEARLR
jgi:HlyD family secretion protein